MSLPAEVRSALEQRVGRVEVGGSVGGGCIHPALRIESAAGPLFLKYGRGTAAGFFAAEAEGLRQLAGATRRLRIPEVLHYQDADEGQGTGWIALEWLEPDRRGRGFSARLAEGLTELHEPVDGAWGWERDGFIGTLPQTNAACPDWATFWRSRRLEPQLELARRRGSLPGSGADWERLMERLPELLAPGDEEGPSLLHGDLWGGNILATARGEPAVVDPAAYRGHREVDLAMSELFGGLDREVYREYEARRPLLPGYREARRGIYQLYYLLVHVNLFGEGYAGSTAATLREVLGRG